MKNVKVSFGDKKVRDSFYESTSKVSTIFSLVLIFVDIPDDTKLWLGGLFVICLFIIYIRTWHYLNKMQSIELSVEGSTVNVKTGDIFRQNGLKAIAFNEYFDTQVDDVIISKNSLNGKFIKEHLPDSLHALDEHIDNHRFDKDEVIEENKSREVGKKIQYDLGTICVYHDFLLTAFTHFDQYNRANLTMPEYLRFLITFWDKVNRVYAQRSVSVPIFGSGITRIKEHKNISDEDLLKIMLWTFRISETRFKHPAKLTIVIHPDKIDRINLADISNF